MIKNSERPYIVKVDDVTVSRAFGTSYTNTTGRTLIITAIGEFETKANPDYAILQGYVGGVDIGFIGLSINAIAHSFMQFSLFVPPGSSYRLDSNLNGTGTLSLLRWIEAY